MRKVKRLRIAGFTRRAAAFGIFAASVTFFSPLCMARGAAPASSASEISPEASGGLPQADLVSGFRRLYELDFSAARSTFLAYQKAVPDDPMGKTAEAASYLYEEFNAKGVFTSEFFLDDDRFLNGVEGKLSQNHNPKFLSTNAEAREMARAMLKKDPRDVRALLAVTIADGMESDYDAIIEKKQFPALGMMRLAESEANALLAIAPDEKDAYVALGASNYIIGSMPSYKRAFLWFGGVHGDRERGMQQMQLAADNGRYLRPFAKVLLALACEREHQNARARVLLGELAAQFPANPLFAHELALLDRRDPNTPRHD